MIFQYIHLFFLRSESAIVRINKTNTLLNFNIVIIMYSNRLTLYIVLYCIVLYCIVLYCIVLHLSIYIAPLSSHGQTEALRPWS